MLLYSHTAQDGRLRGVDESGRWYSGQSKSDFDRKFPPAKISEVIEVPQLEEFRTLRHRLVEQLRQAAAAAAQALGKQRLQQCHLQQPVRSAYEGSNPLLTRKVLKRLEAQGVRGRIAAALFRAQKASSRAKRYRGDYKGYAYDKKGEALAHLSELLSQQTELSWGWGLNDTDEFAPPHILYVDLPQGQVSFHSPERYIGPDYTKPWDGLPLSAERIISFGELCLKEALMTGADDAAASESRHPKSNGARMAQAADGDCDSNKSGPISSAPTADDGRRMHGKAVGQPRV